MKNFRVEICGGIASGKTTLSYLLKSTYIYPLIEDFKKSPFWEAFYTNPGKYIFETEVSFILLHYHQIKKAIEQKHTNLVCDFSFLLDLAYAKIGLSGSKLKAFECVLNELCDDLPIPVLYIYLECNAETQLKRINRRKRPEESLITADFLKSLNDALNREVNKVDQAKVITINSDQMDFADSESVQSEIIALVNNSLSL